LNVKRLLPLAAIAVAWCLVCAPAQAKMAACAEKNALWGKNFEASGRKLSDAPPARDFAMASECYGYETAMGRASWPSPDPIGERGGLNLYVSVENSPTNYVDPLGLVLDPAPSPSSVSIKRVDKLVIPDADAETQPDWPSVIAQVVGFAEVKVSGKLGLKISALFSTDLNRVTQDGRTVENHERHHAEIWEKWWKENKRSADPVEGTYCNITCAEIARDAANAITQITYGSGWAENLIFDWDVYGKNSTSSKQFSLRQKIAQAQRIIRENSEKLTQLEKQWFQNKCKKSK